MSRHDEIKQLSENLSLEERKLFGQLCYEYPQESPKVLAEAAKNRIRIQHIQKENTVKYDSVYKLEERRELCYYKYKNNHGIKDPDVSKKLCVLFYSSQDPDALMICSPEELLRRCS